MASLPAISTLWIGDRLSWLEQLCLKSFADAGHKTTLYSYTPIDNIPPGVEAKDAATVFPAKPMLRHALNGSPAIHADLWRLHLLKKTEEIWVDADMYCRRPFAFDSPHVYGWEKPGQVCNAVLGLPADSPTLDLLLEIFKDPYAIAPWLRPWQQRELQAAKDAGTPVHITEQKWGFTGPSAVTWCLKKTGEIEHAQEFEAFYPVSFKQRNRMFERGNRRKVEAIIGDNAFGVHFWARRLKPRLEEVEGNRPHPGSYLQALIEKHEITPEAAPIPIKVKTRNPDLNDPEFRSKIGQLARTEGVSPERLCIEHSVDLAFVETCRDTAPDPS